MATPPPVIETVLDDMAARLGKITVANGYSQNVGRSGVLRRVVAVKSVRGPAIILVRQFTEEIYGEGVEDVPFGAIEYRMNVMVGWVLEDHKDDPTDKAERMISDIHNSLPLQPSASFVQWGTLATVSRMYVCKRKSSVVNVTDAVPGKIHGQVNYLVQAESAAENDRYVP